MNSAKPPGSMFERWHVMGQPDALADAELRHPFADLVHYADDLMAELLRLRICAVDLQRVGAADAADAHAHDNFARAGRRLRHFEQRHLILGDAFQVAHYSMTPGRSITCCRSPRKRPTCAPSTAR
ncbi:MAG: hypothetical protein NTZ50_15200 [Chloroflexi bacterium]|nr:hypothetical protein [Chloroflexota bacterium]